MSRELQFDKFQFTHKQYPFYILEYTDHSVI